jgi:predicted transcriptional regulator of viral defense system
VIYAKDVSNITGVSKRTAWNLLSRIKKRYKKKKGQYITVKEFADFTGIAEEEIKKLILN